jgi:hypothetical protein
MVDKYREWFCPSCGHIVMAKDRPEPIKWTDGHTCRFVADNPPVKERKENDE